MPIQTIRKKGENSDRVLNRFNRTCQRLVRSLRKNRYLEEKPSKLKKRTAAIIRAGHRAAQAKKRFYN